MDHRASEQRLSDKAARSRASGLFLSDHRMVERKFHQPRARRAQIAERSDESAVALPHPSGSAVAGEPQGTGASLAVQFAATGKTAKRERVLAGAGRQAQG